MKLLRLEKVNGKNVSQIAVLTKACELCEEEKGSVDWRCIPEKYWQMALNEYRI